MKQRGFGSVFCRGKVWWIKYYYRGGARRESSHSPNCTDAMKLLRRRNSEIGQGRLTGPDIEKTTFEDLMQMIQDDYAVNGHRSMARLQTSIKALSAFFSYSKAQDITLDRLNQYVRSRLDAGLAPASVHTEVAALQRAFTLAVRAQKALAPAFPTIRVRNTRTGFFERDQLEAVRARLSPALQPLVTVAYLTGWRTQSELLPLRWAQVDFHAATMRLEPGTTKNDEGRVFPFGKYPELAEVIQTQRARTTAVERTTGAIVPWVFHRNGKPIKHFRAAWNKACCDAGVPGLKIHDLRRSTVRNLERSGVSRSVAMKLTGHKTESVYRRYAIVSESDLSDGVAKLAGLGEPRGSRSEGQVLGLGTKRAQFALTRE